MLISSHRLDEVAALVNRVIELDQGKVVLDDLVADLLKTGATLFGTPESREALQRYLRGESDTEEGPGSA